MSDKKIEKRYEVSCARGGNYCETRFVTLKEAEDSARSHTMKYAEPYAIMEAIYVTKVPEIVANIQIEKVQ